MHGVHVTHSRNIAKYDLVGANANDGTIHFEEFLNCLALSKTKDVCDKPKVGDGIVPWARYRAERRQEKIVDNLDEDASECYGTANKGEIMAEPGGREVERGNDGLVHSRRPATLQGGKGEMRGKRERKVGSSNMDRRIYIPQMWC